MHLSLITALSLSFVALSFQQNAAPSLKDLLAEQKNLTSFTNFLTNSLPDLLSELEAQEESRQPVTILAPSNAAFDKIPYYSVIGPAWGSGNLDAQREIMKYHILPGDITTDVLLPTFQYFPTWLTNSNFANVTNGQRVGAVMQGGKLLFFVSGTSNRSPSTVTDLKFAGGTVHILDSLLIPPESFAITSAKFSTASEPTMINSFLGAAYANKNASLISLINGAKDITIFAPNNAAMETVGGTLTSMSEGELEKLLSYHIVINNSGSGSGGPYYSTLLTNSTSLKTLQGNDLTVSFSSNSLFANSARILTTDLLISGGVVHVIDNVLNPDSIAASPNPSLATQSPVLETAAGTNTNNISDTPFTSYVPDVTALAAGGATSTADGGSYVGASRSRTSGPGRPTQTAVAGGAADSRRGSETVLGLVVAGMMWGGWWLVVNISV